MKRRRFISGTACAVAAMAAGANVLAADGHTPYSRAAYDAALASGKPFMLDFYAPW